MHPFEAPGFEVFPLGLKSDLLTKNNNIVSNIQNELVDRESTINEPFRCMRPSAFICIDICISGLYQFSRQFVLQITRHL